MLSKGSGIDYLNCLKFWCGRRDSSSLWLAHWALNLASFLSFHKCDHTRKEKSMATIKKDQR